MWNVLAGILLLGNLKFVEDSEHAERSIVANKKLLDACARNLSVTSKALQTAICEQVLINYEINKN